VTDLRDFIAARLDEDEQIARNASMGFVGGDREVWAYDRQGFAVRATHGRWNVATRRDDPADGREIHMTDSYGEHIARQQPIRVLREVAAKRRILERHEPSQGGGCAGCGVYLGRDDNWHPNVDLEDCEELRDLASVYADHKDFREEWAA